MTKEIEMQTQELTSADLEQISGGSVPSVSEVVVTKTMDSTSSAGGGGGGAGKVSMRDFSFI
jgi:hypothetical protein